MSTLSIGQVYNLCRAAGFSPGAAAEMVAIAIAESGLNPTIEGDQALTNATYGTSVGLFQVRTVRAETGKGTDRDRSALLASPARQAQAAYEISHGGKDFRPWSTWLHGTAQAQLGKVYKSLGASGVSGLPPIANAAPVPSGGALAQDVGLVSTPLGWLGGLLGLPGASAIEQGAAKVALLSALLVTGGALIVIGGWRTVSPTVKPIADKVQQTAQTAATAAVMV